MNRDIKIGIALVTLLVALVAVFYFLFNDKNKYDWSENYNYNSDQPYGADMLYSFLEDFNSNGKLELIDKESISSFFKKKDSLSVQKNNTYFIIGNDFNFAERDYESLKIFMEAGNTAVIISSYLDDDFIETLNYNCESLGFGSNNINNTNLFTLKANFENEKLKTRKGYNFFYEYNSERLDYPFSYFGSNICRDLNYETLGEIEPDKVNFIKIKVGDGQLLLHSNPIFFSNRHLIRKDAFEYASKVFSYLPEGDIFWDKHNKPIKIKKPAMEGNEDDTPFTYILKQRSFKWAFYLIYVSVILFLIFNLFRKQRQIPVLFQNKNTSLEFIKNVGTLYFENKDNKKLAHKIMTHFMNEIRLKYYISEKNQELMIQKLASKTKMNSTIIEEIFTAFSYIEKQTELSDDGLVKFYLKIEKFHKSIKK